MYKIWIYLTELDNNHNEKLKSIILKEEIFKLILIELLNNPSLEIKVYNR
jgi:hypothetical protein